MGPQKGPQGVHKSLLVIIQHPCQDVIELHGLSVVDLLVGLLRLGSVGWSRGLRLICRVLCGSVSLFSASRGVRGAVESGWSH